LVESAKKNRLVVDIDLFDYFLITVPVLRFIGV